MALTIAVAGATGNVGRLMIALLARRNFPAAAIHALASPASAGAQLSCGARRLAVEALDGFDFASCDLAFFALPAECAAAAAPLAARAGCLVIDNSSHFRLHPEVPLIIPEINGHLLAAPPAANIIANPNCSTAQLLIALQPLHQAAHIQRVVVATYQSASGAGRRAMEGLAAEARAALDQSPAPPPVLPKRLAFNVVPQCGGFAEDGNTGEESKIAAETAKILDPAIKLTAACARVPVMVGHAQAVNVQLARPLSEAQARAAIRRAPGCTLLDERRDGGYMTPLEAEGRDPVFVSRIRRDPTVPSGLNLWVVADNLRKGAALNAIQIAERLCAGALKQRAA